MSHHVLLIGGHGKISQLLTPLLLKRSWTVTSLIRSQEQESTIQALGANQPGKLHVLVRSLESVTSDEKAKAILDEVKPDYVVWSAGAGGKGPAERTTIIDRDAASHFVRAGASTPTITRFLLVSYIGARRARPAWWDDEAWTGSQEANQKMARYHAAKVAADEELVRAARGRGTGFAGIDLRPGTLKDGPAGRVELGRTKTSEGTVSRASVAAVADALLAEEGVESAWLDLLEGENEVTEAVRGVVAARVDALEGEPVASE